MKHKIYDLMQVTVC